MNLSEYLTRRRAYALGARAASWQEAVRLCTDILQRDGVVTEDYNAAILEGVEELGFYFLIGPGLAMPHARPERGALQEGYALVTLAEPVPLGEETADVFLAFAATSAEVQNTRMMCDVAVLLGDDARVAKLRQVRTHEALAAVLADVDYSE